MLIGEKRLQSQSRKTLLAIIFVGYWLGCHGFGAPEVGLTSPADLSEFGAPADITLSAQASEAGGIVSRVEFYSGAILLGEVTSSPYTFQWESVPAGTYTITARAYNGDDQSTDSDPANVTVLADGEPTYSATLAWDANSEPDISGYRLSYGEESGNYTTTIDVGNVTTWTLGGLPAGTYYAVVTAYNTAELESPASTELVFSVLADGEPTYSATLAWDANSEPDISGYRLSYGEESENYTTTIDVGNVTTRTLEGLPAGTYYAVVTAYNTAELESPASTELVFSVPLGTLDETPPVIAGMPMDISVAPPSSSEFSAVVGWIEPTASDDSGSASLNSTHSPGATFYPGTTTVTYTAQDAAGNTTESSFTITVSSVFIWRQAVFASNSQDPAVAGNSANPDGDAWNNLAEYALGLQPTVSDGGEMPSLTLVGDDILFHLSHIRYLPDVELRVESFLPPASDWSTLATRPAGGIWVSSGGNVQVESEIVGDRVEATISCPQLGKEGEFFRIRFFEPQ